MCLVPYNGGVAALIATDGPEKNTIQWAPDGINFEIMSVIPGVSAHAIGLNRSADMKKNLPKYYVGDFLICTIAGITRAL